MTRRKPEQIVRLLRKADEEMAKGKSVEDFRRDEQISPATYYRWQRKYGGLQVDDAKRNGFIESFHDKFCDECLQREWFSSLLDAQVVIEDWRLHYDTLRPHSSLKYKTPAEFAAQFTNQVQLAQSLISAGHKN